MHPRLLVAFATVGLTTLSIVACAGGESAAVLAAAPDGAVDASPGPPDLASDASDIPGPDAGLDADLGYTPPIVTTAIAGLAGDTWQWVPLDGALCRDGSATGIGVSRHEGATKLVIVLQGGGSCEDADKCAGTPLNYGAADFAPFAQSAHQSTIFDRQLATNPVKDWNMVFVPYCTGDQHGGNAPGAHPADVPTPQQFVGYVDMTLALARLAPTFPEVTKVLLSGDSAGGAGVIHNYLQTARTFSHAVVDTLDDSGPPLAATYLAPCLQDYWAKLWRFDRTSAKDCGAACATADGLALGMQKYVAATYPASTFGVLESAWDGNISRGYALGSNDCAALAPGAPAPMRIPEATFGAGLGDLHAAMAGYPNFGLYVFAGEDHTTIQNTSYATRTSSDVPLTTWVAGIVSGTVVNVAP